MDDDYDNDVDQQSGGSDFAKNITEGWKEDRKPDFLKGTGESKSSEQKGSTHSPSGGSTKARGAVSGRDGESGDKNKNRGPNESEGARGRFTNAERGAVGGGFYTGRGLTGQGARENEENPSGFSFTGKGLGKIKKGKGKHRIAKMSATAVVALGLGVFGVGAAFIGGAQFTIGNLDFNLMHALGYEGTVGLLEKQALNIIKEWLKKGILSDFLGDKLATQNFMVGQLTANGDFVRTNQYIADVDKLKDLAVLGNFQIQDSESNQGELAILYDNDRVITAEEFLAVVDEDPEVRAKLEVALELGVLYYYGRDADAVLSESGAKRDLFADWEDTGNLEENEENFKETLKKGINGVSELALGMIASATQTDVDDQGNKSITTVDASNSVDGLTSGFSSGEEIVNAVRDATKDNADSDANASGKTMATYKAAQLMNQAISAGEPYQGVASFMMIEEVVQRTRISPSETPVNELLNYMQESKELKYTDVVSGEEKTTKDSIFTTPNFAAAVSNGRLFPDEAVNFSRDRGIVAVELSKNKVAEDKIIKDTRVQTEGKKESNVALKTGNDDDPDASKLAKLNDSMQKSMIDKNTKLLQTTVGGNRNIEGGAFLSNMINTYSAGAMWSDNDRIKEYHAEVEEVLAKKAEAQRAIKSPFDITSPYTFLGSIAHSVSNAMIRNGVGSNSGVAGSVVGTFADLAGDSMGELFTDATADGNDYSYEMTHGSYCDTADSAAKVKGDIYCNPKTTLSTKYMKLTEEDWKNVMNIDKEYYENKFVPYAMDRKPTVGIKSSDICEKIKNQENTLIDDILDWIKEFFLGEVYTVCSGLSDAQKDIATGKRFTNSKDNDKKDDVEKYSGFALYDKVSAMLSDRFSLAEQAREKYYAAHPLDNSRAGKIARISGLSKKEAEIAIAYHDYMTYLALYDPSERYAFSNDITVEMPRRPLVDHANQVASEMYILWHGRTEYDDLRSRIQVV